MNKYDVGILTFWNVPNYGTFAQAYALQRTLDKILSSKDVRQIAYLDEHHYNCYYNKPALYKIWSRYFWLEKLVGLKNKREIAEKEKNFKTSYLTIKHTEEMSKERLKGTQFKYVVLGSDIIWDYTIGVFNRDKFLFGNNFLSDRKISYAASFGTVNENNSDFPEYVTDGLKDIYRISVRDKKSADIVEKITGQRPTIVLDPVWMWDFNTDNNVIEPEIDNYIAVYGQDFSQEFINNLILFAKENNKKIVALDCNNDNYSWCDVLIKQKDMSPYQWFGFFKGADYIATSTFHGLTFGLVFEKKIAFYKTDFIMAKVSDFLKQIDIYDLFDNKNDVKKMLNEDWDYTTINKFIDNERAKSCAFIKEAFQ